ncbi:hypothetical protein J2S43_007888 [Catenuloplanes nepalensis]|uniref:Uncharacterized protein n=1 Tax=Catenuloplanes nepalensis TaxID=587533 RepID=A0ABT9N6Q6_9ACTN|nr:hypothetical protein [Catenuloplanes nepalensis]MDP9799376.1 hypothetical protein [Catenuloplanes nepalensis]
MTQDISTTTITPSLADLLRRTTQADTASHRAAVDLLLAIPGNVHEARGLRDRFVVDVDDEHTGEPIGAVVHWGGIAQALNGSPMPLQATVRERKLLLIAASLGGAVIGASLAELLTGLTDADKTAVLAAIGTAWHLDVRTPCGDRDFGVDYSRDVPEETGEHPAPDGFCVGFGPGRRVR